MRAALLPSLIPLPREELVGTESNHRRRRKGVRRKGGRRKGGKGTEKKRRGVGSDAAGKL